MTTERALTTINESGRAFIGAFVKFNRTRNGRSRLKFDICIGNDDPSALKFAIWRKVVLYDSLADQFRNVKPGTLVRFSGYLKRDILRDSEFRPIYEDGKPVTQEHLFPQELEIIHRDMVMPTFDQMLANQGSRGPD